MVRQTAEGLGTYDIGDIIMDKLHHLAGQEPSLAGLIADGYDGLCKAYNLPDGGGGIKVSAAFKFLYGSASENVLDGPDTKGGKLCGLFLAA